MSIPRLLFHRWLVLIAVVVVGTMWIGAARLRAQEGSAPVARVESETKTLTAAKDTFAASARADQGFGGANPLYVGQAGQLGATRTLVYFEFDQLEPKYVVLGGDLRLYQSSAGPAGDPQRDIVVYRVEDDWGESSTTWNHFPDWKDSRIAGRSVGTATGWQSWEVDRVVRDWYREEEVNYGFYVQGYEAGGSFRAFDSREGSNKPELRLEVVIDATPPIAALDPTDALYVTTPDIVLAWPRGTDPEPASGIATYQVWFQRGEEAWALAAKDLKEPTYVFRNAENGRVYGFQIRAVDRAGNLEPLGPAEVRFLVDYSAPVSEIDDLPTWSTGAITLRPTGYDLPNGQGLQHSGLLHFDIDARAAGGAWTPLFYGHPPAVPAVWPSPPEGVLLEFRVRAIDRAFNIPAFGTVAASTTVDMTPPAAWFGYTDAVDTESFRVRWDGDDAVSKLDTFDLEYRVGTTGWQTWLSGTRERFKDYVGEFGRVYTFRVRARDNAGNAGAWASAPTLLVIPVESAKLTQHVFLPVVRDNTPVRAVR